MSRQGRAKAVSVLVVTIGLCGAGVLAAAPLIGSSAVAEARGVHAAASPTKPEPPENAGPEVPEDSDLEPEVTVTVTETPEEPVEVTETVTVTPKKPKKPKTTKPVKTPPPAPDPTTPAPQPQPLPSQDIPEIPSNTSTAEVPVPSVGESSFSLPAATGTALDPTPSGQAPVVSQAQSTEVIAAELREGIPEMDRVTLSRQLAIPALVLTLLALFAVLFYEKRLRRMVHAAAVRTAGPGVAGDPAAYPGYPGYPGYPAGPGYVANYVPGGYPAGPAYTTVVSFVPVPQQQPVPPYDQQPVLQLQPEADAGAPKPTETPAAPATGTVRGPHDLPPESYLEGPHDRGGFDDFKEPGEPGKSASTWFSPSGKDTPSPPYRMPADTPRYGPEPPPATPDTTAVYVMPELPKDAPKPPEPAPEVQEGPGGAPKRGLFKRRKP
ncbi:hypothetical protein [Spongiactinospora rosea]|uniref:hypothetical protein n=1 Tax=Spongiactinospora rosea TaxID=2248750 RepID=UPI0011C01E6F|nr:hypothetical protein [Spongiactinospora rosea]